MDQPFAAAEQIHDRLPTASPKTEKLWQSAFMRREAGEWEDYGIVDVARYWKTKVPRLFFDSSSVTIAPDQPFKIACVFSNPAPQRSFPSACADVAPPA